MIKYYLYRNEIFRLESCSNHFLYATIYVPKYKSYVDSELFEHIENKLLFNLSGEARELSEEELIQEIEKKHMIMELTK